MFSPSARVRVYLCREAVDMRCSFDGLSGKVRTHLKRDPLSGHLYCFLNRRRNYMKALYWDRSGYCLWAKRLVRGTFTVPGKEELSVVELHQVLDGLEILKSRKKKHICLLSGE